MTSEGSCDTEDWSNDAENSTLRHRNKIHFQIYSNRKQSFSISQYYNFLLYLWWKKCSLRVRDFFQQRFKSVREWWKSLNLQREFLPQASSVLFLGSHGIKVRQLNYIWPSSRTRTTAQTTDQNKIQNRWSVTAFHKVFSSPSALEQQHICIQRLWATYLISSSCRSSWLAWKIGFLVKSSPKIQLYTTAKRNTNNIIIWTAAEVWM